MQAAIQHLESREALGAAAFAIARFCISREFERRLLRATRRPAQNGGQNRSHTVRRERVRRLAQLQTELVLLRMRRNVLEGLQIPNSANSNASSAHQQESAQNQQDQTASANEQTQNDTP